MKSITEGRMEGRMGLYHDFRLPAKVAWQCSEHELQVRVMRRCELIQGMYPEIKLLHAIPNGGKRHMGTAMKLKAEGAKSGVPDLFLPAMTFDFGSQKTYNGLYVELKKAGGCPSANQRWWLDRLSEQGYFCVVSNDEVVTMDVIEGYLCGRVEELLRGLGK